MSKAKSDTTISRQPSHLERLETQGTAVKPDAPPPNGEIIEKSNVVGAIAKLVDTQYVGQRRTAKHIFSIPGAKDGPMGTDGKPLPVFFALWGDAALSSALRKMRQGDYVGLVYDGMKPNDEGNDVHNWRVFLITARGDEMKALVEGAEDCYAAIRQAVKLAKQERSSNFGQPRRADSPPPHGDSDYTGW